MFCPKCAAQNIDGASFCRVCGANISLIPQALTGQLPPAPLDEDQLTSTRNSRRSRRKRTRESEPPSLEKGIVNIFVGIGFLVAALAIMSRFPGGIFWGWTFFFPAFDRLGRGIAAVVASRKENAAGLPPARDSQNYLAPPQNVARTTFVEPASRRTGELLPSPPSVTEGTTRHLGAEAPTRHLDSQSDYPK